MININIKSAERLIEIKNTFKQKGSEISDKTALEVLKLLNNQEINDNNSFRRMVYFAASLYLVKFDFNDENLPEKGSELTGEQKLLILIDTLPSTENDADGEKMYVLLGELFAYFNARSKTILAKKMGLSRETLHKQLKIGFLTEEQKIRYNTIIRNRNLENGE